MAFRWVYQAGSIWVPFDDRANAAIENLWRACSHGNVYHAGSITYVNAVNLYMLQNNWVYEAGNTWVPFDCNNNRALEQFWRSSRNGRVIVNCLPAYVYPRRLQMFVNNSTWVRIGRTGA
ncbi:hypothetical protein K492DRAFT_190100 [Lichtheimia hyalospora FSU 10163]|nr:hypothetical protein K492DRAFT_190100 [Lichtheimia hyalospora FSU 10163]